MSVPARAQNLRVHGSALAGHAVGGHQERELGWGGAGLAAGELRFAPEAGVALQGGGLALASGDAPSDPSLAPLDGASSALGTLGLRAYPFASGTGALRGAWVAAGGGLARTGSQNRPALDAQLGWDVISGEGRYGVGPSVALVHVFQPDGEPRPADANLVLLGVHAVYGPSDAPRRRKPASDRDHDEILDPVDRCPDVPEDRDGWQDEDGCPDRDDDRDGVPDVRDECQRVAEDRDGWQDSDGCPDPDDDQDGILDGKDRCPREAEDRDGWQDEDGCPDPDDDQDGVLDATDQCPREPETKNGYADEDGCPDSAQVRVVGDHIELDDRIHFRVNSSYIYPDSYPLLGRLSALIVDHPEYVHIDIEGHTDERGNASFNQKLSEDRAASVLRFLTEHGVAASRLSSRGFGATRPRVEKRTEHAWYENRRVEFLVTRERGAGASGGGQ